MTQSSSSTTDGKSAAANAPTHAAAAIPSEPPRRQQLGFLYLPPYRVQGVSIAGEESVVMVPELDVCFDIGLAPRVALPAKYVALTHGHMDHSAGIAYYFSQRNFQGMGTGIVVCPKELEQPIRNVMTAWVDLEAQRTPYEVIGMTHGQEVEIKNNIYLRGFHVKHTVPAMGYVVVERRSKLKPELLGLPQEKLIELKAAGQSITMTLEVPLVCYTGDTMWGEHFDREDVLNARILITECTFVEPGDAKRAAVGQHLHLDDVVKLVERSKAEAIVLTHLSRRTHLGNVKKQLDAVIPPAHRHRVHLLMDSRVNRARLDQQRGGAEE